MIRVFIRVKTNCSAVAKFIYFSIQLYSYSNSGVYYLYWFWCLLFRQYTFLLFFILVRARKPLPSSSCSTSRFALRAARISRGILLFLLTFFMFYMVKYK